MHYTSVCKALYDYKAQSDDELTFKEDDILYILDKDEDPDWWRAQLKPHSPDHDGPIGLVPVNYVDEAEPIGKVEALYDYAAQQDEELTFHENDVMTLYENDDPDWFLVKDKSGIIGLAPSNYIQEISDHASAGNATAAQAQALTTPAAQNTDEPKETHHQEQRAHVPPPSTAASKADDAISWSVHEYDTEKKKKKKSKGNLLVGNGMLCYGSETDKASPVRQFPIQEVLQCANDAKSVHIQLSDHSTLDFQASSKSEAKAIVAKVQESQSLANATAPPLSTPAIPEQPCHESDIPPPPPPPPVAAAAPAPAPAPVPVAHHDPEPAPPVAAAEPEPEPEPEPACEPRWAIVLYSFDAEGPEEISIKEEDQVLVVDYGSSDEWWSIEYQDGRAGIVPATYVQFQEDYEADLAREDEQRRKQEDQEADKRHREAEAAAARQRRIEEEQRRQEEEERARKAEQERQRRQREEEDARRREEQEEAARQQREQEARRQAAAAAAAAAKSTPPVGSPRRSQIPAPPPPVNKAPATRSMSTSSSTSSGRPQPPKQTQDPGKPDTSKVRTWTDRTGAFKVDAQFLTCHNDKIRLHKVNGVKIDVPVQKMCLEDLRYIEQQTGKKLVEDGTDDVPLAHLAGNNNRAAAAGASKPQWDWFDYFMKANIPMHNSLRYASAFQADGLGEHDLENLTHRKMKSLGMSETHVQRLQRFIETGVSEPASDEEAVPNKRKVKKSVSFGAISVIDDSDNESVGAYAADNRQHQIDEDERLARQLQEEFNAQTQSQGHSGAGLQRRGTGRPTPSTSAPRGVNTAMMDKIKSQLSSQPLTPAPAPPQPQPQPQSQASPSSAPAPPPLQPQPAPVVRQQTGFADDAWAPRASGSPNVANAQADAMAQTKAAWSAPAPPPPPPPPAAAPPAPVQNANLTGMQPQPQMQQSPQQPPVSLPPRQRPTPSVPQANRVDPQLLSQWTSPGGTGAHQMQPQPQPQLQPQQPASHVQQMAAQFTGNPVSQQQPALPPRSPVNHFAAPQQQPFMQSPTTTMGLGAAPMQQQQQPPLPPRSPMNQFSAAAQPQYMQPTGSPMQQQTFMQPVHQPAPAPLVPMGTGMQPQQPQRTGSGANWAAATPDNPFGSGAIAQRPPQPQGSFSGMPTLQPSQVFASMANSGTASFQTSQPTGFSASPVVDPNDKYAVFKGMNTNSPSVFNGGQAQGPMPFQQPQATGFAPMQQQQQQQQPGTPQQQFYNRW